MMDNAGQNDLPSKEGGNGHRDLRRLGKGFRRLAAAYRILEGLTETLLYFTIAFSPWAFGSADAWAIIVLNWVGLLMGAVLGAKIAIRRFFGYRPHRWESSSYGQVKYGASVHSRNWPITGLAVLNAVILVFCFISAINAKTTFIHPPLSPDIYSPQIEHENFIPWLPHSYDGAASWWVFAEYLGLSLVFWAGRDWLIGKTHREIQAEMDGGAGEELFLTARMRRLLWVVSINGGLLALEGILQKLSGTAKCLWISEPRLIKAAVAQFGPWAYRSNGAAYINLVWPICLGFWWGLHNAEKKGGRMAGKIGQGASIVLVPCVVVMASCPFITSSRGGALVALVSLIAAMAVIVLANRHLGLKWAALPAVLTAVSMGMAAYLGYDDLANRFDELKVNQTGGRTPIYRIAHKMADDAPVYGMGPGTFMTLYQFYREKITDDWAAMVHDDYLETRITFGWIGLALILALVPVIAGHVWLGRGILCDWQFIAMLWISMGGCMLHAKVDFPFQIHSILGMFITACCLQSCLVRKL
jgi:O-antigen ligase